MKAMVLHRFAPVEENPLSLEDVPEPEIIHPEEIKVRIRYCGVCHTDLHTVEGEITPQLPIIPGHQIVGEVVERGRETRIFKKGDRVGIAWLYETCGRCKFCKMGMENLCENPKFTGFHVNGGYAEYITIKEEFAYSIPTSFPDEKAVPLLCAGIVGYRALKNTGVRKGEILAIYGFGASAVICIQIAKYWGVDVYVFSGSEQHRELAIKLGASWTGDYKNTPPSKFDKAVIYAPAGWMIPHALENLEYGGTLSLGGIYMSKIPELNYERHLFYEKRIVSTTASTREDGKELMELADKIPIKTSTTVYPLSEANEVLKIVKDRKMQGTGVLMI